MRLRGKLEKIVNCCGQFVYFRPLIGFIYCLPKVNGHIEKNCVAEFVVESCCGCKHVLASMFASFIRSLQHLRQSFTISQLFVLKAKRSLCS